MTDFDQEIIHFIEDVFEKNFEELRMDSGHAISPDVKKAALRQVLLYWRKLRSVAENVTDTEVRLSLPGQETAQGRDFTIEGVVDILRENDRTVMYDIKTHDADYVRDNINQFEQQLNVYAHIWRELRKQQLDGVSVIATDFPDPVKRALENNDEEELVYALGNWDPIVPIEFDLRRVQDTIREFGDVVDLIEDRSFAPPPLKKLNESMRGTNKIRFGTHVCRNCDARYSCTPYREFALQNKQTSERPMIQYFSDVISDVDQEAWRTGNLDAALETPNSIEDFTTRSV
jgi:hypothetical protein